MRWVNRRQSANVEDRRGGMGGALPIGGGIGTLVLVLVVYMLGGDPRAVIDQAPRGSGPGAGTTTQTSPQDDEAKKFVSVVLGDTEDVWHELLRQHGRQYREPKLVLFSGQVQSACGIAGASAGPFYCPGDQKLYIDLSFYEELKNRFRAPGDFAQAYVIAHEVGHHVQNLLGTSGKVQALQARSSKTDANRLSVRLELQADFFAGVWAHYAQKRGLLDPGDIEEGLRAASAIGDDRLQQESQGYTRPDSFTHGTSEQRLHWFQKGLQTGDLRQGNTFTSEP
ncbi:MAG TPA: neutral zinc metallopeptidase [Abditibacteriaceae bacterium]|nr:neutral zinc metallopeptidase [Abditibacteriaceae bacterium]